MNKIFTQQYLYGISLCNLGEKLQWVTGTWWATGQLQPSLTFSNWSIISKHLHYTWAHIVNSNVYVGLLCDDTPLCNNKTGLKLGSCPLGTGRLQELSPIISPNTCIFNKIACIICIYRYGNVHICTAANVCAFLKKISTLPWSTFLLVQF